MLSSPSSSPVSSFLVPRMVHGDDPVKVKFQCKEVDLSEHQIVHISPFNSRTITDSEESSIKANRKSIIGFQPRSCVTPKFSKMGFRYSNWSFFAEISTKNN